MNVLLIEDNEQNAYLVRFLLEARGHDVEEARTGREGVVKAAQVLPDVILLDIQLPEMDGYAVARALRQNELLDDVPVVAVTSYALEEDRVKALVAGCDIYLQKPIDPDTFVATIEAAAASGRNR